MRFSFPDQHGILRGKTLVASRAPSPHCESGVDVTTTLLAKDTSHKTVFPGVHRRRRLRHAEMQGAADFLMVADPTTFRVLPWAPTTGLGAVRRLFRRRQAGAVLDAADLSQRAVNKLGERGYDFIAGLEVEFHVFKLDDPHMAPEDAGQPGPAAAVSLLSHGYQYLTELRYDQIEPVIELLRRNIIALGLPLRSLEVEFGPSQFEFTFGRRKASRPPTPWCCFAAP